MTYLTHNLDFRESFLLIPHPIEFPIMRIPKLHWFNRIAVLFSLLLFPSACGLSGSGNVNTNPYSEVDMKFVKGTCQYAQYKTEETLCNFDVQLRNKGDDPIRISGDFQFNVVSVNDQMRYKNGLDEIYDYKYLKAREITQLSNSDPWSSISEIDTILNPVEKRVVTLAFQVPTNTWVQGVSLLVSRANPDSEDRYIDLDLNICTFGNESNAGQGITREIICDKGLAVHN